ncbi:MAG: VTT domain-containing protein, partial [Gammaproteobacteria bacterium]|nr:VTT domain-containing protein [Gammaproteobacteria bacterium]
AWGQLYGSLIALLGANLAIIVSFTIVRRFHGEGFEADDVNNRVFKKMLRGLEKHPVRTVALLRCLISTAPGLNYGFAISSITDRQHLLGTVMGTIIPVVSIVWLSDWLAGRLF